MAKFILIAILGIIPLFSFAQSPIDSTIKKPVTDSIFRRSVNLRTRNAADQFQKASTNMLLGWGLSALGAGIVIAADGQADLTKIGLIVSGIGFCVNLSGIHKIGLAGRELRKKYY